MVTTPYNKNMHIQPEEIFSEVKTLAALLIAKEHAFRVEYMHEKYEAAGSRPRKRFFQLEEDALWLSLYSYINWLAHFRFMKDRGVDSSIPGWIAATLGWSVETAQAFWDCGRNPLAHTGGRRQSHSEDIQGVEHYISLSLDKQKDWNGANGYLALSPMQKDIGGRARPGQQTIFFYGVIEELLGRLVDDITAQITNFDYDQLKKLHSLLFALPFTQDDGALARITDLLNVYEYTHGRANKQIASIYEPGVSMRKSRKDYRHREAARAVVFDDDGRVALLHVTKYGYHKLPGGGVEEGEDVITALKREVLEEVGCKVIVTTRLGKVVEYRDEWGMRQTSYCFVARQAGELAAPTFTDEELEDGFEVVWADSRKAAIAILKADSPQGYEGPLIQQRDIAILKAADD
jgi:8-oxo-dGTP diphosphatase